jgi:restriction system protein
MKQYKRIMLGIKSVYAEQCYKGGFIGADFDIKKDFSNHLPENWRDFNKEYIPKWLSLNPEKSKIAAGLMCGLFYTICKGIYKGDVVLCPDGGNGYYVGEITSNYYYKPDEILPHRRNVQWYDRIILKEEMSPELQSSARGTGTASHLTQYADEIERLLGKKSSHTIISTDETVEDPSAFALEKHLEDFLVKNWTKTMLGKDYNIYEDEGELVGQQFPTDTGMIDLLAISKDKKTLLVIELKKGRASDNVVGQIQRYMGYVKEELAENNQEVKGIIIALEDDIRIKRALSVVNNIDFYKYQVRFKLYK